jgi:hypothetical protein
MGRTGFHVRLDEDLHARVIKGAEREGVSMNEFVVRRLEYAMDKQIRFMASRFYFEDGQLFVDCWFPPDIAERVDELQRG